MIVIDTSAIVSVFLQEPDASLMAQRIETDDLPLISAASMLEASIVLRSPKHLAVDRAEAWLDEMIAVFGIQIQPVTLEQLAIARAAHLRFGKGTGHPAQLNFGDCFSYALAKAMNARLLFKGDDFARTDIESAFGQGAPLTGREAG